MKRPNTSYLAPLLKVAALLFILNLLSLPSWAWQNDQEGEPVQEVQGYPVMVDGYEMFRVHQTLGAATAQQRAERISEALEELAKAQDFNPAEIKANEEGGVATVRYGDQLIVTINDAEAKVSGLPRKALAIQYARLLQERLRHAPEEHTPRFLWWAAGKAAATVAIYVVVVWLILLVSRGVIRLLETSAKTRIKGIKIQQSETAAR